MFTSLRSKGDHASLSSHCTHGASCLCAQESHPAQGGGKRAGEPWIVEGYPRTGSTALLGQNRAIGGQRGLRVRGVVEAPKIASDILAHI